MFNEYPYRNLTDVNLDYILKHIKELETNLQDFIKLNTIKYADPIDWNISRQYESNTVVVNELTGVAYLSTQPVPAGVDVTNTDYWTPIFTLDFVNMNKNITLRNDGNNNNATFPSVTGDWLIVGGQLYKVIQDIALHTAYVVGYNIQVYSVELFVKDYLNQVLNLIGDLTDLTTSDRTNVVNAINSVLSDLNTKIGDLQELDTTDKTNIVKAINEIVSELNNQIIIVTPEMYGAVGDGVTDDTAAIQSALDAYANVLFLNKTYMVDAGVSIKPNSGNRLILSPNTVLKALPNNLDYYKVIYLTNVNHVEISGGTIVGERDSHLTTTGESGHCINIRDCTDIYIHDLRCTKAWGDGIFIGGDDVLPERILVENCTVDNARRNGIAIIRCDGVTIDNCIIHDISGTAPMDNIDVEPNFGTDAVNNLQIKNCKFDGMVECNLRASTSANTIDIINCTGGGYTAATGANTVDTLIQFIGCQADCWSGSFNMQNASPSSKVHVLNCSSVARQISNDPSRSGVYFAGANNNVFITGLKLYGSKFFRYVQKSLFTPTTFNNCFVDIEVVNGESVNNLEGRTDGLTISLNNIVPVTSNYGQSIYIFEGRKYIQNGGTYFKFGGNVRCNGRFIICNNTGSGVTVSPDSDFGGTFCKSDGTVITSVALANKAVFIGEFVAETNTVVSL